MKSCSVCSLEKPIDAFNWRDKAKGWRRPECRECQRSAYRVARAKDPVSHNAASKERKKLWRERGGGKRWYEEHREQESARSKLRYQDPAYLAQKRAWWEQNKDKHRACSKNWRLKNPDKNKAILRAHYEKHKARYYQKSRRRRAMKLGALLVPFTEKQLDARMSVFGYRCAYCGGPFEHVDHVKPLSKGGPHCLSNLRPACAPCNGGKADKRLCDWLKTISA